MKFFFAYLRTQRRGLLQFTLSCAVFAAVFWAYRLPPGAVWYPALLCAAIAAGFLFVDFRRVRRVHQTLAQALRPNVPGTPELPEARSIPEQDYQALVRLRCAEQQQREGELAARYDDMIEYYTVWAHQIKTPIAAMQLALQNEDTPLSRRLTGDLARIEQYVEMVLAFLRLGSKSTDYVLRPCDIDALVRQAVRRFAGEFIGRRIRLCFDPTGGQTTVTDEKWLRFVVEQVISNALKYTRPGGSVHIFAADGALCIADSGIGIDPADLPRIFEKGYTGCNGRVGAQKSTGIGLYLCKRVCTRLGHSICAESAPGQGTCIRIGLTRTTVNAE